jgi:hypothetical protein
MFPPFIVRALPVGGSQVGVGSVGLSLWVLKPEVISGIIIPQDLPLLCLSFTILQAADALVAGGGNNVIPGHNIAVETPAQLLVPDCYAVQLLTTTEHET